MKYSFKSAIVFLAALGQLVTSLPIEKPVKKPAKKPKEPQYELLPVLELPYGSYAAGRQYDNIWTFNDIPYAAPPVGNLRWEKPAPPLNHTARGIQGWDRHGSGCFQVPMTGVNIEGSLDPWSDHMELILCDPDLPAVFSGCIAQCEDCLLLDIQVPDRAIKDPSLNLPVVVFIPGGSFIYGDTRYSNPIAPFYDGTALIRASHGEIIYVTFNYRTGAFGFLGGKSVEEQAVANVGLWDQRAVFQWVQDHIAKIGGNPKQVTAMGHSEGAASILFQLTAQGGTLDPMFNRAIILSPYHTPMWDREGRVEERFQRFAKLAGCGGQGIECLRQVDSDSLQEANKAVAKMEPVGIYPFGPTPDGDYIRQLPAVELAYGNVWPIESLILSHVRYETGNITSTELETETGFDNYVRDILPDYMLNGTFIDRINEHYPPLKSVDPLYAVQHRRMQEFLRDSCVNCHLRWLLEAIGPENTWVMRFNFPPSTHGFDLLPMFLHEEVDTHKFGKFAMAVFSFLISGIIDGMTLGYKSYMTSFIRTGNPNIYRRRWREAFPDMRAKTWRHPKYISEMEHVIDVLEVHPSPIGYFDHVRDKEMSKSKCGFWKSFFLDATLQGNYTPAAELRKLTDMNNN